MTPWRALALGLVLVLPFAYSMPLTPLHPLAPLPGPSAGPAGRTDPFVPAAAPSAGPVAGLLPSLAGAGRVVPSIIPNNTVVIFPNGTINNLSAPILQNDDVYTLTGNFSGEILDERNGSVLDGAGFVVTGLSSLPAAIAVEGASNVTVHRMRIVGPTTGIELASAEGVRVHSNWVNMSGWSVIDEYSADGNLSANHFDHAYGMILEYVDHTSLFANELTNGSSWSVILEYTSGIRLVANNGSQSAYGVVLVYASDTTLVANDFAGTFYGIYAEFSDGVDSVGNNVSGAERALYLYQVTGFQGTDDRAVGGTYGVDIEQSSQVTLANEAYLGFAQVGLAVRGSQGVSVSNCSFTGSGWNGTEILGSNTVALSEVDLSGYSEYGAFVNLSQSVTLDRVNASDPANPAGVAFFAFEDTNLRIANSSGDRASGGVLANGDSGIVVDRSSFRYDAGAAVELDYVVGGVVANSNLSNASSEGVIATQGSGLTLTSDDLSGASFAGAYLWGTSGATVSDNVVLDDRSFGLYVAYGSGAVVAGNELGSTTGSFGYGVLMYDEPGASIVGNRVDHTNYSLDLENSLRISVEGNVLNGSGTGLVLLSLRDSTVADNSVTNDTSGFLLGWDQNLLVYHNDFVNDSGWQNYPSTESIRWDNGYPAGGNFWSNHTGPDLLGGPLQTDDGPDGIVDHPLVLNATNVDRYPLARSWSPYTVSFTETGLATGTNWSVRVGNATLWGTGPTLVLPIDAAANLSIAFDVGAIGGYSRASPASGTLALNGTDRSVSVHFSVFRYGVSFRESGLANGTSWSLDVGAQPLSGGSAWLNTSDPNGSFSFTVAPIAGYALTTPSGTAVVAGGPVTVAISFVRIYPPPGPNTTGNGTGNHSTGGGSHGGNGNNTTGGGHPPPASPGTTTTSTPAASSGFGPAIVYSLLVALVVVGVLAATGFGLWWRGRRPAGSASPQPWSPPAPKAGAAPTGAVVNAVPAASPAASPPGPTPPGSPAGSAPEWSEETES